jgi:outer membrane protein assembly factor BamA
MSSQSIFNNFLFLVPKGLHGAIIFASCLLFLSNLQAQDLEQVKKIKIDTVLFHANPTDSIRVKQIAIVGNKRTKPMIILRELPFQEGTRIAKHDLERELLLAKRQLINTALFVDAQVQPILSDSLVEMQVVVKERWYLFPLPYFKLIDRNFNQWWVDQKRSLERVNYGVKFIQNNFTGRNDNLDIWLITGYTQQVTLRYDLPFIDKKLRSGFNIGLAYSTQREVNYATSDNKQQFFRLDDRYLRKLIRADLTYSYRPGVKQRHSFRIAYVDESVDDTVIKKTPNYFVNQEKRFQYIDFNYRFKFYNADYNAYPTNGFLFEGNLYHRGGFGPTQLWMINTRAVYALPLAKTSFLHLEGLLQMKFPVNNAFTDQRLLGYGSMQMRGLEYNVVDGMKGGILKTTIHQKLIGFDVRNPFKSKTHDKIPFRLYLKAYTDLGYAHITNPKIDNSLNNKVLHTYGFGLDIISIYDFVFKIEYSFNQLGKYGLYLQSRNDF